MPREKYNIRLKLLFMRCIRPLLYKMVQTVVKRKKLRHERNLSISEYLLYNRKTIERKVQKFDDSEKYVNILYSEDGADVKKWDIRLTIFILVDICMVDTNSTYYLGDVENILTHLVHPNTSKLTRHIYKEYKKRLRKARSRFYKFLGDDHIKRKIEIRAKTIEDGRTNESDVESMLARWEQVECNYNVDEGCKQNGLHRYLTINLLLSETCCDVMRAVVTKRVDEMGCRSLDSFLREQKKRIMRRIETLDTFGRPEEILFPEDRKATQLHEWDITLLCWILLNVCYLSGICRYKYPDALADAIGKFRKVRNNTVHKLFSSLNVSDNDYQSFLRDIKDSIETCLVYIDDPDFSEDIGNKVEKIEGTVLTKDETIRRLQICQKDTAEHELQSNYLQGQCSIIRELSTIVRKFTGLTIPECSLELVFNNCSEDCEKKLSEILVDNINQLVTGNRTANDDLKNALVKLIERCKQKGWKITSAENGSVLLHIKCESFDDLTSLYETYGNKGSTLGTSELQEVVQRVCDSQVKILLVMYMKEMDKCMENIVNSLLEKIKQLSHPAASKKIRLWLESDVKHPRRLDVLDIETRDVLEHISNVLKTRYNLPSLSISTQRQDDNTIEDFEDLLKESRPREQSLMSNTAPPDRARQDFKRELIRYYQTNLGSPFAGDFYVPLDLELTTINNVEPSCQCQKCGRIIADRRPGRKLQNYLEIFENIGCQSCFIYIVGEAGMGKTSLCRKIVLDWSTMHYNLNKENDTINDSYNTYSSNLRKFDFLFQISHVDANKNMENILATQFGIPESTVMECLQRHSCLIILDGLDEWTHSGEETTHFELLKMKSAYKCTLLITSRPWKVWIPPDEEDIRTVTIRGLSTASRYLMIKHLLNVQDIYSIKKYHDKYTFISKSMYEVQRTKEDDLVRFPLLLKMLIDSDKQQPTTLSCYNTYLQLMDSYVIRDVSKSRSLEKLTRLPLSKLAFEMLFAEHPLVFACSKCIVEDILRPEELAYCLKIGLLTSGSSDVKGISFIHKTVQEFYAAQLLFNNCEHFVTTLKRRTSSVERALELSSVFLFLGGMNTKPLADMCLHIKDIVDADKRFQIVRFKGEHRQYERKQYIIFVKSLSFMITHCIAESLYSHFTDFTVVLRDLYIDNDSVQTVIECFPFITISDLKSLHINCDCSLTSTMKGISPIVEQTKDVVEMLHISNLSFFERMCHMRMRSLKSLDLCNLSLALPQIEQLLKAAPKLVQIFLYNFESEGEMFELLSCEYSTMSNCGARKISRVVCVNRSVTLKGQEKYPELRELTLELLPRDFIKMKKILSSRKCRCKNDKHCV